MEVLVKREIFLNSLVGIGSKIQVDGLEEAIFIFVSRPQRGTQTKLEELYIPSGLETPPGSPRRSWRELLERVVGERDEWVLLLDLLCPSHVRDDSREDVPTATVLLHHSRILSNA